MSSAVNEGFKSLVMKQRYLMNNNGETHINYCVDFSQNKRMELFKSFYNQNLFHIKVAAFVPEIDIDSICRLGDTNQEFNIRAEGEFFVKASSYSNTRELDYARELAVEDDARFKLHYNLINTTTCAELKNIFTFLNMNQQTFYQSFISDGLSISEMYTLQRPDLPSIKQLTDKMLQNFSMEAMEGKYNYNATIISDTKTWIDNALKTVVGQNTNIIFKQIDDCHNASLVIVPRLDFSAAASEELFYNNDTIITQTFEVVMPNTRAGWPETMHSFAHIFSDHPNENGFYQIDKEQLKLYQESFKFGTVFDHQQYFGVYKAQSLLPWDIQALRYSYGIPKAQDITYNLNKLQENFGYDLEDKALVTLSNIGQTTIDARDIANYSLDLRYEHVSNFINGNINCSFLLSYDTEVSQVILNLEGSITLSDNFKTNISLLPGCYDVMLHGNNYQNDIVKNFGNLDCVNEISQQIDVYNFDSSLHGVIAQKELDYLEN